MLKKSQRIYNLTIIRKTSHAKCHADWSIHLNQALENLVKWFLIKSTVILFLLCKLTNGKTHRQLLNGLKTFETKTIHRFWYWKFYPSISRELFHEAVDFVKLALISLIKIFPSLYNLDERCYSIIKNVDWKNLVMKSLMS